MKRLYTNLMELPWIVRFGMALAAVIILALLLPKPGTAETIVPARAICSAGKLVAIEITLPASPGGILRVRIDPDVCSNDGEEPRQPTRHQT
jgi:hypothetical protein